MKQQVQIDIARGEQAMKERKEKELADLKAENERLRAEVQEYHRKIALMKGNCGATRVEIPPEKGQKRKEVSSS